MLIIQQTKLRTYDPISPTIELAVQEGLLIPHYLPRMATQQTEQLQEEETKQT